MKPTSPAVLAASAILALSLSPAFAVGVPEDGASTAARPVAVQEKTSVDHELAAFRSSNIRLPDALGIAKQISEGALVADVSFDGQDDKPRYRIRTLVGDRLKSA